MSKNPYFPYLTRVPFDYNRLVREAEKDGRDAAARISASVYDKPDRRPALTITTEAKTLVAKLRDHRVRVRCWASDTGTFYEDRVDPLVQEAADFLERLSAPVEGVGLTRWDWTREGLERDKHGEWVLHDDACDALAAKEAERVGAEERIIQHRKSAMERHRQIVADRDAYKAALDEVSRVR